MANKNYIFGFQIAAALNNNFNAAFNTASLKMLNLNEKVMEYSRTINATQKAMVKGNITVTSYHNAMSKLRPEYEKLQEQQKKFLSIQARINTAQTAMTRHWVNAMQYATIWDKMKEWAQPAIQFESAMADVRKVVDFDAGEKGVKQFKDMSNAILDLSTKIPMAAEGLAQIVAAGGQSGIARDDLIKFAEAAAKMGVAFDISADQAGEMMAKWRTAFKMNQDQVVVLADQINHLGNTTAASAPLISDVVTRIGPLGEIGGVASSEIAALAASMVGAGVESEVAATGIKNMILSLVSGESATKKQAEAFEELGLDAGYVAEAMQKDARGAILEVMGAINNLDKVQQGAVLKELFGKESIAPISTLVTNLNNVEENFKKAADAEQYAGSMQAEFDTRSKTTANSLQLLDNRLNKAKIAAGNGLLPVVTPLAEEFGKLAEKIGNAASEYPGFTTVVGGSIAVISGTCH